MSFSFSLNVHSVHKTAAHNAGQNELSLKSEMDELSAVIDLEPLKRQKPA
ncbi:MAG: hypothetical protein WCJ11_12015 [Methylococcaceae bacterium]